MFISFFGGCELDVETRAASFCTPSETSEEEEISSFCAPSETGLFGPLEMSEEEDATDLSDRTC